MKKSIKEFHKKLYNALLTVVEVDPLNFYKTDYIVDGVLYRIFHHDKHTPTECFNTHWSLECRGSMFIIDRSGCVDKLVCLPCRKFFNLQQNNNEYIVQQKPFNRVFEKYDGVQMSTYLQCGELRLKSGTSFERKELKSAYEWLNENQRLKELLYYISHHHITVNMEWVCSTNESSIDYGESRLVITSFRDLFDGCTYFYDDERLHHYLTKSEVSLLFNNFAKEVFVDGDQYRWCIDVQNMQHVEGYVAYFYNNPPLKIKTDWFKAQSETNK